MPTSTAKIAQGTVLAIETGSGTSVTVTGGTKAKPMVLTATNTSAAGDVLAFPSAGLTGMPEIGGGLAFVASATGTSITTNVDASSFAAAATAGTATLKTFANIANLKDFNGFTGTVSEIDKSHLGSNAKEFSPGLEDFGSITFNMDLDPTDAGQQALMAAKSSSSILVFRIKYPSASTARAFYGFVKKLEEAGQVDGVYRLAGEIRITGRVVRQEVTV